MSLELSGQHGGRSPVVRSIGIGLALTAAVAVVLVAFLWPIVTASPTSLPIAIAGPPAAIESVESALAERAPDVFAVSGVDDRDAAVAAIERRDAYGAIVLDATSPEILVASAASPAVAQQLGSLAPALQAQVVEALEEQGITPPAPIVVEVTDVVPLADTDERGAGIAASSFPLVIGSLLGGAVISLAVDGAGVALAGRRLLALAVYAGGAGLAIVSILQTWFGVLQSDFLQNVGAVAVALLAGAGLIVGLGSVLGRAGVPVGVVVLLLIANPISSAAQPIEFLAQPWGAVGQWFPPGAAATLLRDLSYFPTANTSFPWLVLVGWAMVALLLVAFGAAVRRADRVTA